VAALTLLGCSGEGDAKKGGTMFSKPPLPVTITWRETKVPGSSTQVAQLRPTGEAPLPLRVTVEIKAQSSGQVKTEDWILEKMHLKVPKEFGMLEGHRFVPGDTITVRHKDYATLTETCKALP
jgi:hypothetical protein